MRYDFECGSCGHAWEHSCSMSERPDVLPCPCGGEAHQVFRSVPQVVVRFRPYEFNRAKNVRSFGRAFGRSDQEQHEHYRRSFDEQRKQVAHKRRTPKLNDGFEYLGGMPGEMADSINEAEGKETVQSDPVTFLKKTGLYMGRD